MCRRACLPVLALLFLWDCASNKSCRHFVWVCFVRWCGRQLVYADTVLRGAHVPEPSVDETYEILLGLRERYEAHHKLRYTDEALSAAAKFSSQYISDRFLPDKVR